jgi:signal transduction histidine kinase
MNIQGYIEGSEDGIYSQEEANHLILNENERIKVLVEQMIRLSKAESREYSDFRYEDIDIKSFVEDIKTIVPKKIACTLDTNSKTFYFDRTVLEIIMSNLIQNASRYAKANINIKLDISDSIMLIVSDDGLGIDPQVKDTLFDRFTMGTGGKTGLGLSIVKEYVEATNGSISAFNDNGAVFKILWPNKKN